MSFECEAFGLKGRSSGSIFGQVNACTEISRWPIVIYSSVLLLLLCPYVQCEMLPDT